MEKPREKQQTNYFIYFVVFAINSIFIADGASYSWTSPFLPKFQSNDSSINPVSRPITSSEAGLMVSTVSLGLLFGPLIPALATRYVGKKKTILLAAIPVLVAHAICSVAKTVPLFLVARFLMGLTSGAAYATVPTYIGEICEPNIRGFGNTLTGVLSCFGGIYSLCTGPYLLMMWFSVVNLVPVIAFLVAVFFFVPESPYDHVMKNNLKEAEQSLITLRKRGDVEIELSEIKKSIEFNQKKSKKFLDVVKELSMLRAVRLCTLVMLINAFSGICIILGYAQTIFDLADSSIPSEYSAITISGIALFSTIIQSYLIDRLGRKILITASCFMVFLSYLLLGASFFAQQFYGNVKLLSWLPIGSLMLFMLGFYTGLTTVPFIFLGECFPSHIKAVASSFCSTVNFFCTYVLTLSYSYLIESIGTAYTFWVFAFLMGLATIYCIIFVPETKGKTLQEIEVMLNKRDR